MCHVCVAVHEFKPGRGRFYRRRRAGKAAAPVAPNRACVRDIVAKSLSKQALSVQETACLLAADEPDAVEEIFAAARRLKRDVYGNRIVVFAPLYIGNNCVNDCAVLLVQAVQRPTGPADAGPRGNPPPGGRHGATGHKRMIIVFGEHPRYDADFIARCVREVYGVTVPESHGEIRRVNVNAAPLDVEGYRVIKDARIGTFQIFQESYHHATYARYHPAGTRKSDYLWRLDGLSRAIEAGLDDVGIGALFGLYDWRFEVLGLVSHALHLQSRFGCGPHTISFPRLQPACGVELDRDHRVGDHDFKRLIAILRLAVPYTGLISRPASGPRSGAR